MVQCNNLFALVLLPSIALAVPHPQRHGHAHVTKTVTHLTTVWGNEPAPTPQVANQEPAASPPPVATSPAVDANVDVQKAAVQESPAESPQASPSQKAPVSAAPPPVPSPAESSSAVAPSPAKPSPSSGGSKSPSGGSDGKQVVFKNNCGYPVDIIKRAGEAACASLVPDQELTVQPGGTWTENLPTQCQANGRLEIFKEGQERNKPMLYEYGYQNSTEELWYNISIIDCLKDRNSHDFSTCAGGPWSFSASGPSTAAGQDNCTPKKCSDYDSCCRLDAYCDPYAETAGGVQPVMNCGGEVNSIKVDISIC